MWLHLAMILTLLCCWPRRNKMLCCELPMERVTWLGTAPAFRRQKRPLAVSQQNAGAHRFITARKWILPIIWMSLKMYFSPVEPPDETAVWSLDGSLVKLSNREPSYSMTRFLTHRNLEIVNMCCCKPQSMW